MNGTELKKRRKRRAWNRKRLWLKEWFASFPPDEPVNIRRAMARWRAFFGVKK
jgi:hypothetical protein